MSQECHVPVPTARAGRASNAQRSARVRPNSTDRSQCPRWVDGRTDPVAHGTEGAYKYGCRCADALDDKRIKAKRRRESRHTAPFASSVGPRRRLQALGRLGWRLSDIALHTGLTVASLTRIRNYDDDRQVHARVADTISAFYEQCCMSQGPSERTRALALRQAWRAPLEWDDIDDPHEAPDATTPRDNDVDDAPDENTADALMTRRLRWHEVAVTDRRWAVSVPLAHLSNIELGRSLGVDSETVRRARRNYAEAQQKNAA